MRITNWKYGVASLLCTVSGQAFAQTAPPANPPAAEEAAATDDIVVVANRREQRLQHVPIAVTAATADQLTAAGITHGRELSRMAPNLLLSNTATVVQPVIRGIGGQIATQAGDEANVATYVDGVYYSDIGNSFSNLIGVERVEVLRGPQGTLFGRNATGGLINVITRLPDYDPTGEVIVEYGSFETRGVRFYGSTGITDSLAINVAGYYGDSEGYISDLLRGGKQNPYETYSLRARLLWEPSNNFRAVATVSTDYRDDPTVISYYIVDNNTIARFYDPSVQIAAGPWNAAADTPRQGGSEALRADLQTRWDLGVVVLETTLAYAETDLTLTTDRDNTPNYGFAGGGTFFQDQPMETWSGEARLISDGEGKFDWIVGANYFLNSGTNHLIGAQQYNVPPVTTDLRPQVETRAYALFGEGTYRFTEALHLTAGIRYTNEERDFEQFFNGASTAPRVSSSDERWTPRVTLQYFLSPTANIYATYSEGFKSGGFNVLGVTFAPNAPQPVEPEELVSYEIGFKTDVTSWLRVNAAAFLYDYTNMQVTARNIAGTFVLQNAASADIQGAELEFIARATDELTFRGSIGYTEATYASFPDAQNFVPTMAGGVAVGGNTAVSLDVSGNRLVRTPEYTLSFTAEYARDTSIGEIGGNLNWYRSSDVYWDTANRYYQPEYDLISAEVFWAPTDNLRLALRGTNLTDEVVARQLNPNASGVFQVNEPPAQITFAAHLRY